MWNDWAPYVSVADRLQRAKRAMKRRQARGLPVEPLSVPGKGKHIAHSFWGQAWCQHLEALGDLANRLPRGRSYVRNGSVCHLEIARGRVNAFVMGNELYDVQLNITALPAAHWRAIKSRCAGGVGSVLELLEGRLSRDVMKVVTDTRHGLFPQRGQIRVACSCPDWASVCKHVAAVFYGVGVRLDERPELLFLLRGVDHQELIDEGAGALTKVTGRGSGRRLSGGDLADVFGIDLVDADVPPVTNAPRDAGTGKRAKNAARPTREPRARKTARRAAPGRGATPGAKRPTATARSGDAAAASRQATPTTPAPAFTGAQVRGLRAGLKLDRGEFAALLGVSQASITRWESHRGRIGLQARTLDALNGIVTLSPAAARRRLAKR